MNDRPQPQPQAGDDDHGPHRPAEGAPEQGPGPDPSWFDDERLRDYLADALAPAESARVEKALRESAELRARLEDVRHDRADAQLHTLGAIWRRGRLTCPSRQQLGSYLLDALAPELADYLRFHLDIVECPFCRANLADLESQAQAAEFAPDSSARRKRFLQSSQHLLGPD